MGRIALITDSSACLPPSAVRRFGIRVLPILIHLESGDLRDGMGIAPMQVYEALARGEEVKSSAPSPLEYLTAIDEADADAVVVITPATEFTIMHRNASVAAELADRPVAVVDSRTAAAAQGLVVMAACEAGSSATSVEEVVEAAEDAARRADLVATLESIESIRRSGRVPPVALEFARRLGVRPVFRLREGAVERLGLPRSVEAALRRIHQEWVSGGGPQASASAVFHAVAVDRARELSRLVGGTTFLTEFSPSMGIHTGPGVVGVAWLRPPTGARGS